MMRPPKATRDGNAGLPVLPRFRGLLQVNSGGDDVCQTNLTIVCSESTFPQKILQGEDGCLGVRGLIYKRLLRVCKVFKSA